MELTGRIAALATAIANHIRDSITPRLLPPGGATGQVLAKISGTNYATAWQDVQGGSGSGVKGTVTVTPVSTVKNHGALELEETVAATGITPGMVVVLSPAPTADTDENCSELLDLLSASALAGTDTLKITATFATRTAGPVKFNYVGM